jgi:hypothetical protein
MHNLSTHTSWLSLSFKDYLSDLLHDHALLYTLAESLAAFTHITAGYIYNTILESARIYKII